MNYRDMLEKQNPDKIMIIEDGNVVTYGQLLKLAEQERKGLEKNRLVFLRRKTIAGELAAFIARQGGTGVPVLVPDTTPEREIEALKGTAVPEHAVMGVLTSGTTGGHKVLFRTYESWADFFPCQNKIFSMTEDTVMFAQGSLAFTGNLNLYMALFSVGGTVVATKRFAPRYWHSLIQEYMADTVYLIPAKMLALCRVVKSPCTGVKHFVTGSQSFGIQELNRVKKCFPEMKVTLYYGSSEANYITYLHEEDMTEDSSLVGWAFPQVEVTIRENVFYVDNQYGIIGMEHPFCTNDLGHADAEGKFYFDGRRDDLLNVNGKKCSAYAIEQAMRKALDISEVLVKTEREKDRDVLVAFYERGEQFAAVAEVRKSLKRVLPEQQIPKKFIHVKQLPRTDSGKVKRNL